MFLWGEQNGGNPDVFLRWSNDKHTIFLVYRKILLVMLSPILEIHMFCVSSNDGSGEVLLTIFRCCFEQYQVHWQQEHHIEVGCKHSEQGWLMSGTDSIVSVRWRMTKCFCSAPIHMFTEHPKSTVSVFHWSLCLFIHLGLWLSIACMENGNWRKGYGTQRPN